MDDRKCAWCLMPLPKEAQKNRTLCSSRCKKAVYYYRHKAKIDADQCLRNKTKEARAARRRYKKAHPQKVAEHNRARIRRRNAEIAISLLIMPIEGSEINQ